MVERFPLMIPGAAPSTQDFEVRSPYSGELLAQVARCEQSQAEKALENAYALFRDRSRGLPEAERIAILERTAERMDGLREELALGVAAEGGKPLMDARIEVARAIEGLRLCAQALRTQAGRVIPMRINAASAQRLAFTQPEPIGVVVAVSAFNHPLNLIVHQVGPAIAAGCPVIVKPAEATPLSCIRFVSLLREAGLPEAWCQVLTTENALTERVVCDPRTAFLSFIGSARVGWRLRSRLAPGTRCALEHGGAAPVIVARDADLHPALPLLTKASFYHAGQVCVSVQRIFVDKGLAPALAAGLSAHARQLIVGDPCDPQTEVGPLINRRERDRVHDWVHDAIAAGAELLVGGVPLAHNCYVPTVLRNPPPEARVSREEVFGPVVCVYDYDDLDEAIARANSLPYAFQAAVFTRDLDMALHAYRHLDASAVMINDHTAFRVDWMPFAGLRQSGLGVGGIEYTFRDMQLEKMAVIHSPSL